jgi:hypothetical protein
MTKKAIIGGILTLAGAIALATPTEASVNGRQREQQQRIREGRQSGELTNRETARLERQERAIRQEERRFRANDGKLGPYERAKLNHDLNRTSRHIYEQKHDGQVK